MLHLNPLFDVFFFTGCIIAIVIPILNFFQKNRNSNLFILLCDLKFLFITYSFFTLLVGLESIGAFAILRIVAVLSAYIFFRYIFLHYDKPMSRLQTIFIFIVIMAFPYISVAWPSKAGFANYDLISFVYTPALHLAFFSIIWSDARKTKMKGLPVFLITPILILSALWTAYMIAFFRW